MNIRGWILLVAIMLLNLAAAAQEEGNDSTLFNQFLKEDISKENLKHLAELLKESEFSTFARELAKEYLSIDFGSLPRGEDEKTIGELRDELLGAVWRHHLNSEKPENYLILLGFLKEDWGYKTAKGYYERYLVCWRSKITVVFHRLLKHDSEKIPGWLKEDILNLFTALVKEDRIPNAAQQTMIWNLTKHRNPNQYISIILDRTKRIEPEWKRGIFIQESFFAESFSRLNETNKRLFLQECFRNLSTESSIKDGNGVFLARFIVRMAGIDISQLEKSDISKKGQTRFFQDIIEAVLEWGRQNDYL